MSRSKPRYAKHSADRAQPPAVPLVPRDLRRPRARFATMTAVAALMSLSGPALAGPTGGSVVAGSATISQTSTTTNVNQSTGKAIINWQGFSIGANETVNFNQPNSSSVTLNRVIGNETSVISGAINANGQVFIVNSAGVVFTRGAQVNVGGLVASTLDIANDNFLAGNYTFSGTSNAAIVNQGRIRAHGGGYVSLLGKTVSNDGVISARLGTVAMAAGQAITLNFGGNSLVDVTISQGALNALVANKRAIIADGGTVIMTAKAADQVLSAQVNNSGIIQARTVASLKGGSTTYKTGSIKLLADGGTTTVSGRLDASAPKGGDGGKIETSGDTVTVVDGTVVTTAAPFGTAGTWLIDPTDFTISSGGATQSASGIGADTLAAALAAGSVSIVTSSSGSQPGDIIVNAPLTWSASTMLTLTAANSINVSAAITASGASSGLRLTANGGNIYDQSAITMSGAGATVAMTAANSIYVTSPIVASGASSGLALTATGGSIYDSAAITMGTGAAVSMTAGADININSGYSAGDPGSTLTLNASGNLNIAGALNVASLTATAGGAVNIGAAQTSPGAGSWTFTGSSINVNNTMTWSAGTLTLNSGSDIYVNAVMQASGTASLVATYGTGTNADGTPMGLSTSLGNPGAYTGRIDFSGTGTVTLGGRAYSVINSEADLAAVANNPSGNYVVGSDLAGLSAADVRTFGVYASNTFTGNFNGLGHALTLASVPSLSIDAAQTIAALPNTNLVLTSAGDIAVNATVTSGAGLLTFNAANNINLNASVSGPGNNTGSLAFVAGNRLTVGSSASATGSTIFLDAIVNMPATQVITATNAVDIDAVQTLTTAPTWTFGGTVNINAPVYWAGTSPLTLTATKAINVYTTMVGSDANSGLVLTAGTDINVIAASAFINPANAARYVTTLIATANAGNINVDAAQTWAASMAPALTLTAAKDINVNAAVTWSAGTLALNAGSNIYVNAVMATGGTANFAASFGTTGFNTDGTPVGLYTLQSASNTYLGKINFTSTGSVTLNNAGYTVITADGTCATCLRGITSSGGPYVLGGDITVGSVSGFTGLGSLNSSLNGFGHVISMGSTNQLQTTGLFDTVGTGVVVSNLSINGATVVAGTKQYVGILANVNNGAILNSFVYGTLNNTAIDYAGGLVGQNAGTIAESYFYSGTVAVASSAATNPGYVSYVGGLVGTNLYGAKIIQSSVRSTSISGTGNAVTYAGGLVGSNAGTISLSWAADNITTTSVAGDFVGRNTATGTIDQSYAKFYGNNAGAKLAGFVGLNEGTITNAYTTSLYGTSTALNWAAGFAYQNSGTINDSYAASYSSLLSGNSTQRDGFVYSNTGTLQSDYWYGNYQTGNAATIDGSTATAQLFTASTGAADAFGSYAGFNTGVGATGVSNAGVWGASASGYPILNNIILYVGTSSATYGNATPSAATLGFGTPVSLQGGGGISQADSLSSANYNSFAAVTDNGFVDAGAWSAAGILASPTYTHIQGVVTVAPATLYLGAGGVLDKIYDGTATGTLVSGVATSSLAGFIANQTLNVTYTSATFSDKNAGTDKAVTLTYTVTDGIGGGKASNYIIPTTTVASITPKTISAAATGTDKVYDGTTVDSASVALSGILSGDVVTATSTATFADQNAASGKTVTVSGISLSGTDAGNYALGNTTATTTATITQRPLNLLGIKAADGSTTVSASNLSVMNVVAGDVVQTGGSVTVASASSGTQAITSVAGLTVTNSNYTVVGASGAVVIGTGNLVVDQVASGTATPIWSGNTLTITTSDKAVIDWTRFSIAASETVVFAQPAATSVVLNRVIGNEPSVIAGTLKSVIAGTSTAGGRVFIVNSAGVLFTSGSQVNVGAIVASTLDISDSNFAAGNLSGTYAFANSGGAGWVASQGSILAADGGFVALLSQTGISHAGVLTATDGKAMLASANSVTLNLDAADVGMSSSYSIANLSGATYVSGTITLSGSGGLLETDGASVVASGLTLNGGTNTAWSLTQGSAITIGSGGTIGGNLIGQALGVSSVSLTSVGGGINVNDLVNWKADTKLALTAASDIDINAAITADVNGAAGNNSALAFAAGNSIYINNAVTLKGTSSALTMSYGGYNGTTVLTPAAGTNYNILTKASYAGAVLGPDGTPVAQVDPHNPANGGDGIYGSITLSGASAGLTINGQAYTLIHSMGDLATDGQTNAFVLASVTLSTTCSSGTGQCFYDPATGVYDISKTAQSGGKYYDPEAPLQSNPYDLTSAYAGTASKYYFDIATQKYDIPYYLSLTTHQYWDPGARVYTASAYTGTLADYYYDTANSRYDNNAPTSTYYAIASDLNATVDGTTAGAATVYTSAVAANLYGTLAGLGHTINDLTITKVYSTTSNTGVAEDFALVGQSMAGSLIRDVGLTYVNINISTSASNVYAYTKYIGALVGNNFGNISNAYSTGAITLAQTVQSPITGGLVGYSTGASPTVHATISNSYSDVSVTGPNGLGGLVGRDYYTDISNSHTTGTISGNTIAGTLTDGGTSGGLIGYANFVNIFNSYATGNVIGNSSANMLGGLIGNDLGAGGIINSFYAPASAPYAATNNGITTYGNISGGYELGGLVGILNAQSNNYTIQNSYSTGSVAGYQSLNLPSNPGIGGLVGYAYSSGFPYIVSIVNSYTTATAAVSLLGTYSNNVGGLVGFLDFGYVIGSYAQGAVTSATGGSATGGLIGTAQASTVFNSYATGAVTGNRSVGGLIGANSNSGGGGLVISSYATGAVTGDANNATGSGSDNIGGLVGSNSGGIIIDSHASGNVRGLGTNAWVGGLVGTNSGAGYIANSYETGAVSAATPGQAGGLVGADFNNSGNAGCANCAGVRNSYYLSDVNPGMGAFGNYSYTTNLLPGHAYGGAPLTSQQFKDVQYYLNGTITQVLAVRAAEAAAAALRADEGAASQAGSVIGTTGVETTAATPPNDMSSAAGQQAATDPASQAVGNNFNSIETQVKADDRRAHGRTAGPGPRGGHRGPGFGTTIRSIDIDGQHFDLRDNSNQPAPSGPQQ